MSQDLTIRIDLNAPVTLSGCGGALRSIFEWWMRELVGLLPTHWQERLRKTANTPRVFITEDGWRVEMDNDAIITFDADVPPYEARRELEIRAPLALTRSAEIVLLRSVGLSKRIQIPASAMARIREVVRLQLDRLSPFRGDDVQFDCYAVEEVPSGVSSVGDVLVEVVMVPKRHLIAIEQMLRASGVVPKAFSIADIPARFAPRGLPWTRQRQYNAVALVTGLSLAIAAILLGPPMRDAEIADLRTEAEAIAPQVRTALFERDQLERYQLPTQALSSRRAAVLELLADLTKRFPDSAHITRLDMDGDQVALQGSTSAPLRIKSVLARSPWLTHVGVVQGGPGGSFAATAKLLQSKGD